MNTSTVISDVSSILFILYDYCLSVCVHFAADVPNGNEVGGEGGGQGHELVNTKNIRCVCLLFCVS